MLIEDVACPVDKLADMTMDLVRMFEKYGYHDASCFGHALEGNLHLVFSQVPRPSSARPLQPQGVRLGCKGLLLGFTVPVPMGHCLLEHLTRHFLELLAKHSVSRAIFGGAESDCVLAGMEAHGALQLVARRTAEAAR